MAENPTLMLYRVIGTRLSGNTDAGTTVYARRVPKDATRPYLLISVPTNTERNFHHRLQDPAVTVQIKAVSTDLTEALAIIQQAVELVDEQGEQDLGGLVGGTDWHILKVHVRERMSMDYEVGTSQVFEEIFNLSITLQEK